MRRQRVLGNTFVIIMALLLLSAVGPFSLYKLSAAEFGSRRLTFGDSTINAVTRYELRFSGQSGGTVGSIRLQLCTNDPFPGNPCVAPTGLDFLSATLSAQSGMTGFSIHPSTTANELVLTRVAGASVVGTATYALNNVHNPSTGGTVFGRLETFATTDATGISHDAAGLAVAYEDNYIGIQSYVPPYLLFCIANTIQPYSCDTANGNFTDFGEFSSNRTATGQSQILVATNADFGYTVRITGTTLTSGINTIPPMSSTDISRQGVSQFGLNLRANGAPPAGSDVVGSGVGTIASPYNSPNYYTFIPGDVLISSSDPDNTRIYTVTYIANVAKNQAPGIYVSTLTYVALASF